MNREAFLARVRDAARQGRAHRVKTKDLPASVGYVGGGEDPATRFVQEVNAVGGQACLVNAAAAARERLAAILKEHQPAAALCWEHPLLERFGLRELLEDHNVQSVSHQHLAALAEDEQRTTILAAEIGISSADWAIAETGTVAVASAPGRERAVTLLPPVLVTLVKSSQIVPDLFDLFDKLDPAVTELPSNLALITGPSKTGDIELQLTTGVHGPGVWHVIVCR